MRRGARRQVGEVQPIEGVVGVAVGVVFGVRRRLDIVVVEQVELLTGAGCCVGGGVGGVGHVGVDGGGVVGEQFDAVGQQAGVFVGPRVFGVGDVAQVFGCCGE